ncbi:transcription factor S-II, central domain-containing protein [Irpex rosettiformis]|uniref:Transcription factor S-II, central domain-containing protein n=1 Tax=Irpex rosettiformis TaxID=378272 RepID=A0ACB8TQZ4_9APHY|nr:transcription factor S-II, central domain-containing protein [Irpex rosettiformis]
MSTRSLRRTRQSSSSHATSEKENVTKVNGGSLSRAASKSSQEVCFACQQPDDGSPMIHCSECKEWFHFKCLQLDSREAEDIHLYVCASCTEKTGLQTVMEWEGPEAVEELSNGHINPVLLIKPKDEKAVLRHEEPEESSDDGTEDEYVEEEVTRKKGKRRAHVPSSDSEGPSEHSRKSKSTAKNTRRGSALTVITKRRSASGSPGPNSPAMKRRKSTVSHEPASKRKRSESLATPGGGADAARKYCSTKLQDIFVDIFLNYPVLQEPAEDELIVMKKREDLTPEEKQTLEEKGRRFATELEECVFNTYSEPDTKTGHPVVGMKYKERFRMLTFNLSKSDRIVLHQRIAASHITPKELATMSSTDLADEATQKSIKQAEQEALQQTILKKTLLPTAKMTHKGMQDIEDVSGALSREREREREEEEEERFERERLERLRLQAQRAAAQGSIPPESPTTPITASWGAPPPVPLHALDGSGISPSSSRPPINPLFMHTSSDMVTSPVEQELNLADLINIDDEPGQELSISLVDPVIPPIPESASPSLNSDGAGGEQGANATQPSIAASATGLSPFAARSSHPDFTSRPSFDLNAIWSSTSDAPQPLTQDDARDALMEGVPAQLERAPSPVPVEGSGVGANDQDFDMFLEGEGGDDEGEDMEESTPQPPDPEDIQEAFETAARVWNGKISMPLDLTLSQEVSVSARQIGGRTLGRDSSLWRTLFPTDHLRIDGRVPVDKSAEYLTQMRLNPHKELIAVAFSPENEQISENFATLSKYLISKNRHGLVFPWGNRPKEHHPGRELYIVPLVSAEPLPEFVELLDEMKLPQTRNADYMIGIWVLNKGKLAPPPGSSMPPVLPPSASSPPIPAPLPSDGSAPLPVPTTLTSLPPSLLPPNGQLPVNVSAEALAAEVASLTPEQIQLMLQALTAGGQQPPSTIPPPPHPMPPVPPGPSQPWMAGGPSPPYPPYGPPPGTQQPPYAQPSPPPPPQGYGFDHDRQPYPLQGGGQQYGYDRGGDRDGDRGGYRGRHSRNRDRDRDRDRGQERQRDSGWRGRGRGRGRGGGGNHSGNSRNRGPKQWDGPPQQQW